MNTVAMHNAIRAALLGSAMAWAALATQPALANDNKCQKDCPAPAPTPMDIRMPGMDGLTAIRHLRTKAPPVASLPVIVVTADTSGDLRERCEAAKADDVIMKPVAFQQLVASMGRVLANKFGSEMMIE